eukprot:COSAG02_NODE_10050_length_2038_cov_2.056215_3_plen_69_part_01
MLDFLVLQLITRRRSALHVTAAAPRGGPADSLALLHVAPYGANAVRVRMFAQQPTVAALSNPGYLLPPP